MLRQPKHVTVGIGGVVLAVLVAAIIAFSGSASVTAKDPQQRVAEIARLAAEKPSGAADTVADLARSDPEPVVRVAAVAAAAQLGRQDAARQAVTDESASVRAAAAQVLGQSATTQDSGTLVQMYKGDKDAQVRAAALRGLAQCKDPDSIVVLMNAAESGPTPDEQIRALHLLAARVNGRVISVPTPNTPEWLDVIERMKRIGQIQRAFDAAGVVLQRHPEHLKNYNFTEHDSRLGGHDHGHDHDHDH